MYHIHGSWVSLDFMAEKHGHDGLHVHGYTRNRLTGLGLGGNGRVLCRHRRVEKLQEIGLQKAFKIRCELVRDGAGGAVHTAAAESPTTAAAAFWGLHVHSIDHVHVHRQDVHVHEVEPRRRCGPHSPREG